VHNQGLLSQPARTNKLPGNSWGWGNGPLDRPVSAASGPINLCLLYTTLGFTCNVPTGAIYCIHGSEVFTYSYCGQNDQEMYAALDKGRLISSFLVNFCPTLWSIWYRFPDKATLIEKSNLFMRHLYLTPPLKVLLPEFCIAIRAQKNYNDGSMGELTKLMLFRHNTRVRRTDRKTDRIPIAILHTSVTIWRPVDSDTVRILPILQRRLPPRKTY